MPVDPSTVVFPSFIIYHLVNTFFAGFYPRFYLLKIVMAGIEIAHWSG
jgi:hypothetical protein